MHDRFVTLDEIRRTIEARPPIPIEQPARLRPAAVLVPLVLNATGELDVLFTRRTDTLRVHPSQIAFPGGSTDARDANAVATALRETEEELGIPPSTIEVIGELDQLRTSSDFVVSPVVGYLSARPNAAPNTREVAEVLYVPLEVFVSERTMEIRDLPDPKTGVLHKGIIFYRHGDVVVWGATARILRRLVERVMCAPVGTSESSR